jgi:hypothetical protein
LAMASDVTAATARVRLLAAAAGNCVTIST